MPKFIPIEYRGRSYPGGIDPQIEEVAAHFDSGEKDIEMDYSLHTEYSYGKRDMSSGFLEGLEGIKSANKSGVPQLWYSKDWAGEFCDYIERFIGGNKPPELIEIHPPFDDYCSEISDFLDIYKVFEEEILDIFPSVDLVIENRFGTVYRGGSFLVSRSVDTENLSRKIKSRGLDLRLAVDFPQIFSAENLSIGDFNEDQIRNIVRSLDPIKDDINCVHLWGKRKGKNGRTLAHFGTLDTYFGDGHLKEVFLSEIFNLLDDDRLRYFVPEVNGKQEELQEIVNDLISVGFRFQS